MIIKKPCRFSTFVGLLTNKIQNQKKLVGDNTNKGKKMGAVLQHSAFWLASSAFVGLLTNKFRTSKILLVTARAECLTNLTEY